MGSGPGSSFGLREQHPPPPPISWMFTFGRFTDSYIPHKQETRGLDKIQATSFLGGYFFQDNFEAKGDLKKNHKIRENHTM